MRIDARGLQRHISADIVINAFYARLVPQRVGGGLNIRWNCNFKELRYAREFKGAFVAHG